VTSHHIGLHRLPSILRTYATAFPNVELDIQFKDSEEACNRVLTGKYDLGVVTRAPTLIRGFIARPSGRISWFLLPPKIIP